MTGAPRTATDDLISGQLVVGPAARSVVSNINSQAGRPPRLVEKWQAIRHTLAPDGRQISPPATTPAASTT